MLLIVVSEMLRTAALIYQDHPMRLFITIALLMLLEGCAQLAPQTDPPPEENLVHSTPWAQKRLSRAAVPAVYVEQWQQANNRETCALLAPAALGAGEGATVRAASFADGWGLAYDTPQVRSAFGIAGTGVEASAPTYDDWPFTRQWPDGSWAGYGPEGGEGPNQLAYLRIQGQGCLYNVWSRLGRSHLEYLLEQLRFVEGLGR